jgi:HEAT repeat protein
MSDVATRLASAEPAERAAACRDAARDPAGALLVEPLVAALADPEPGVAAAASESLVALARSGSGDAIVPLLRRALQDRGQRVRAVLTLIRIEAPAPALLPALVAALGVDDGPVRWAASRALVDMGRLHAEILRVLAGLVRDAAPAVRRMATLCLRELAPDHPAAALALVEASHDADASVRRAAVTAMAGLVDPPAAVRQRLEAARGESDGVAAQLATLALARLGQAPQRKATEP